MVLIGPFVRLNDPAVLEILGWAGFDFAILDLEHAGLAVGTFVEDTGTACKGASWGARYLVYAIDVGILYRSCKKIAGGLKG